MSTFSIARDLLLVVLLGQLIANYLFAALYPEDFGRWLQKIDTGRFEMIDCDCTGEWAEEP